MTLYLRVRIGGRVLVVDLDRVEAPSGEAAPAQLAGGAGMVVEPWVDPDAFGFVGSTP